MPFASIKCYTEAKLKSSTKQTTMIIGIWINVKRLTTIGELEEL